MSLRNPQRCLHPASAMRVARPLLWKAGEASGPFRRGSGNVPAAFFTISALLGVASPAIAAPPIILFQPVEQRAISGGRTELGVSAQCAAGDNCTPGYQWLKNGEPLPGAVSRLLIFSPVRAKDAGSYQVIVRGGDGETHSRPVPLHVTGEPPAPGTLDPDFIVPKIENPQGGVRGTVYAIAPAADGGTLIGGDFTLVGGSPRPGLAKLTARGELDSTFLLTDIPSLPAVRCLAPVPGGWLAGGSASTVRKPWLAFIPSDGGRVVSVENGWSFQAVSGQEVRALLPLTDGRVMAGGTFTAASGAYTATRLLRLNADRTLDTTFPNSGWNAGVLALSLTPTGNIIAGGPFSLPKRCLARLLPDGTHDAAFAVPATGWSAAAEVSALAVMSTGRIIAGGKFSFTPAGSFTRWSVAAFQQGGEADANFAAKLNTDGKAEIRALLPDGPDNVIIGGRFTELTDADAAGSTFKVAWAGVARLKSSGRPANPQRSAAWDDRTVWSLAMDSLPDKSHRLLCGGDFAWPALRLTALRVEAPPSFAPVFLSEPVPRAAVLRAGDPLRISIAATAWPEPAWQWFHNGQPVAGAMGAELFIPNSQPVHAGRYTVRVTNAASSVTSAPVDVAIHPAPPGFAPVVAGSSSTPLSVAEFTSGYTSLRMAVPFAPARITATLRISHTDTNDLSATLIAPGGQRAQLFHQPDPTGRDFDNTVFDDSSTLQLSGALPPFRGTYQTGGALQSLRNSPPTGDWFLEIENDGGQTAVLESWQLMIEGAAAPVTYETWRAATLTGAVHTAPDEDADGDGYTNAQAWLFGPAPCAPDSTPGGLRQLYAASDGTLNIQWCGWQSAPYQLEWSANLTNWQPAAEGVDCFTTWISRTEPARRTHTLRLANPTARFWRLRGG